jgi:hypothetical protein
MDAECGVCCWTWLWFALCQSDRPLLVTDNRCIQIENTFSAVVFCECEIIQLFSVVFFVFRAVHKFYFRFVINKTTTSYSDRDSCLGQCQCLLPTAVSNVKGLYPRSAGRLHSLGWETVPIFLGCNGCNWRHDITWRFLHKDGLITFQDVIFFKKFVCVLLRHRTSKCVSLHTTSYTKNKLHVTWEDIAFSHVSHLLFPQSHIY